MQDFSSVTRCESEACPRAAKLAADLGITAAPLAAGGPFAYGLVARGEAQTFFDVPDDAAGFDSHLWAHAAGALLVTEAGGTVTDTVGNPLDFSTCKESATLPAHVVGVFATNGDLHPEVLRKSGLASLEAAASS